MGVIMKMICLKEMICTSKKFCKITHFLLIEVHLYSFFNLKSIKWSCFIHSGEMNTWMLNNTMKVQISFFLSDNNHHFILPGVVFFRIVVVLILIKGTKDSNHDIL